jgi:transcriptional regulator with XRE-family HTH domain
MAPTRREEEFLSLHNITLCDNVKRISNFRGEDMHQVITWERTHVAISQDEREFFIALGARITQLRKGSQITQVQLGQTLAISQSTVNAYELGHRRVPVSTLPLLARTLGVSVEELIGEDTTQARAQARKRGRTPKLMQHMERINALPKTQQKFVMQMIEMALAQASIHGAAR